VNKILILIILCLALCSFAGVANPQQTSHVQPPPAIFAKLGLTGIAADQQYLYVMAGGKILQYKISDMTFVRSVDLPDITPPQGPPPKPLEPRKFPPHHPMGGPPHGLWAANGVLYVLGGPSVHLYNLPDLTLKNSVQLPKPDLPEVANPRQTSDKQPPPAIFAKLGLTGIAADQQYLYVMAGGKILQYKISDMTFARSVDLPDIAPPQGSPPKPPEPAKFKPHHPMGGPPHGLWVANGVLYVLAGHSVHLYSLPDLTLKNSVQLPKPELPEAAK
jgi:hypothetical protein